MKTNETEYNAVLRFQSNGTLSTLARMEVNFFLNITDYEFECVCYLCNCLAT